MDPRYLRARSRELVRELGLFAPQCSTSPLTPVEAHLLIELDSGPLTNNQLAERLKVDKSNTSRPLARLEERGFICRIPHEMDGRSQQLQLTDAGAQQLQELHQQLDEDNLLLLAQLSADEQQRLDEGLSLYLKALKAVRRQHDFHIRPLTPADQTQLASVIRQVSHEYGLTADRGFSVADQLLDQLYEVYQAPGCAYWVLIDPKGQLCGGAGIGRLQGAERAVCELQKMYLLPDARGRGLGRRLVLQALQWAQAVGYQSCYLETTACLHQAVRLYHSLGFREQTAALGCTGHVDCEIRMTLALDHPR